MRRRTAILTAIVIGAFGIAAGGTALAATGGTGANGFLDSVAKHLGITREKLDEATKAAASEQVDQALADGKITKEQADAAKERIESGEGRFFGFRGGDGFGHHGGFGGPDGHLEDAATFLGLSVEELRTQLAAGKTLAEVAKAQGKTVEGLKQALIDSEKAELDAAVKDGRLTQAQADELLERKAERLDAMINGTFTGRGGHHGGFGPPPSDSGSGQTTSNLLGQVA